MLLASACLHRDRVQRWVRVTMASLGLASLTPNDGAPLPPCCALLGIRHHLADLSIPNCPLGPLPCATRPTVESLALLSLYLPPR